MPSTREERERAVAEWRKSGLPAWKYAEQRGLKLTTLQKWAWQTGKRSQPAFIEVQVPASQPASLEVVVGAFRVVVPSDFDEATLRRLLVLLEGR